MRHRVDPVGYEYCDLLETPVSLQQGRNVLLTGAEKEELGILVFDVTSVPTQFVEENAELVAKFLAVTAKANEKWNSGAGGDAMLAVLAKDAGMSLEDAQAAINTMGFPGVGEQQSAKWLGGGIQTFMKGVAEVFVNAGSIETSLDSYEDAVAAEPMDAVAAMQ